MMAGGDSSLPVALPRQYQGAFLGICLLVTVAYWPSLQHLPRSDHSLYLAGTYEFDSFSERLGHALAYGRARFLGKGDAMLYRPLFWALWPIEEAMVGYHGAGLQAIGILLHLAILFFVMRLVAARAPPSGPERWLPLALIAFAGVSLGVQEMVIWSHLHGYLLFLLLFLIAIDRLTRGARLATVWAILMIAAFVCELGQVTALAIGAYIAWSRRAARVLGAFATIPVVYQIVNLWDAARFPVEKVAGEDLATLVAKIPTTTSLVNLGRFLRYTLVQPFMPWLVTHRLDARMWMPELGLATLTHPGPLVMVSWLTLAGVVGVAVLGFRRARKLDLALVALVLLGYACAYVFGRMNLRTEDNQLEVNTYYGYYPMVLAAVLFGWSLPQTLNRRVAQGLLALLVVLTLFSGWKVRQVNAERAEMDSAERTVIEQIERFIADHRHEPDFGIAFAPEHLGGISDPVGMPVVEIFFKKYTNHARPKYVIAVTVPQIAVMPYEVYMQHHSYRAGGDLFPKVVHIRSGFKVFQFRGRYFASPGWNSFDPLGKLPSQGIIETKTAEDALRLGQETLKGAP